MPNLRVRARCPRLDVALQGGCSDAAHDPRQRLGQHHLHHVPGVLRHLNAQHDGQGDGQALEHGVAVAVAVAAPGRRAKHIQLLGRLPLPTDARLEVLQADTCPHHVPDGHPQQHHGCENDVALAVLAAPR